MKNTNMNIITMWSSVKDDTKYYYFYNNQTHQIIQNKLIKNMFCK